MRWQRGYLGIGVRRVLGGDRTPGGSASALLLENDGGLLLENGFYLMLEA